MKGLAKLDAMPAAYALHLPRCRSIHTFTMRFPLDLIWLGKDGRPVRVDRAVPPNRMKLVPARPARSSRRTPARPTRSSPPAYDAAGLPPARSSGGGWPSWPSSAESRPNSSPTVQSATSRPRRR